MALRVVVRARVSGRAGGWCWGWLKVEGPPQGKSIRAKGKGGGTGKRFVLEVVVGGTVRGRAEG